MDNKYEKEIIDIYVEDIIPNRFQPRLVFDEKALQELAASIKQHGIIQPLVLRKIGDKYEIIAGERRYKAANLLGMKQIPSIIMELDDKESAEVAVVENIQRRDLTPLEEAKSYKKLLSKGYLTQEQLATRMGKNQATVSNKLRLLNLEETVQDALLNGKISERHARALLSLKNSNDQVDVLEKIINNKMTVRQTEDLIKSIVNVNPAEVAEEKPVEPTKVNEEYLINEIEELTPTTEFDIQKIKEEAMDINPIREATNIENLLNSEEEKTISMEDIKPVDIIENETIEKGLFKPTNKFINSLEDETTDMNMIEDREDTPLNQNPTNHLFNFESNTKGTNTESLVEEYRKTIPEQSLEEKEEEKVHVFPALQIKKDLKEGISDIRILVGDLEKKGFIVDLEEFDFENIYQVIIKISK